MLNPFRWALLLDEEPGICSPFQSLSAKSWVECMLLDLWLLHRWTALGSPPFRYIPFLFLQDANISEHTKARFRRIFGVASGNHTSLSSSITLLHVGGNHYCCMAFIPLLREVHILGRLIGKRDPARRLNPSWELWGGDKIYETAAKLHDWDLSVRPAVYEVNWPQNGYDCGPIAVQVMEEIWSNGGLNRDHKAFWRRPLLACPHSVRMQMAEGVHTAILTNIDKFNSLCTTYLPEQIEDLMSLRLTQDDRRHVPLDANFDQMSGLVRNIARSLRPNPGQCLAALLGNIKADTEVCGRCLGQTRRRAIGRNYRGHKEIHSALGNPGRGDGDSFEANQSLVVGENGDEDPEEVAALVNRALHVGDWSQASLGRFPRPTAAPVLPRLESLTGLNIPFSSDFDDYEGAPTSETLDPIPDTQLQFAEVNVAYMAEKVITNPWTTFIDYGYRLLPDFAQAYVLKEPIMLKEHLMPAGINFVYKEPNFQLEHDRHGNEITVDDVEILGAGEMLTRGKETGDMDMFVTGKTADGKFVCVDLERDQSQPVAVQASVDIDSIIWTTRFPKFKKSVSLFQRPVIRPRAPIYKHNHTYIDILFPQTPEEFDEPGERFQWSTRRFKLSQIPHVLVGTMGDANGSANLYMVLPRMIHRHPYLIRWSNNVPWNIQGILWDEILLPSMSGVVPEVETLYVGLSQEHSAFKDQDKGSKLPPTHPFRPRQFEDLLVAIQDRVSPLLH